MVTVGKGGLPVGRDLGCNEYEITPELVGKYCDSVDDHHEWYEGSSPFGGALAPALLMHSDVYNFKEWYLDPVYGNLHARQEWELFAPIMVGGRVRSHATIVDRFVKRNRDYVVNEVQLFEPGGPLLLRGRTHQSFLMGDADEGAMVVDKKREKSSARKFEIGEGKVAEELAPLEKPVTLDMCKKFSRGTSYHNDVEKAKELGFPDIVVQGMMPICFLSELMTARFGEGWFVGGRMTVNLVNVLWGGDRKVTCRGVVREFKPEGERRRAQCEVWVEKSDGTKIIVGTASAVVD